ncbi:MAG TPA: SO2930 family diheme c-type cytochrome, partial [Chryseosolibacter sp.]|nr:SO2930 family diheme c-type cytochrome [Chryseosolibacter sp.]
VPKGESISYDTTDALPFPVGTILVKNFSYMSSTGSRHLIETRLLLHRQWGWDAEVYEWNEDQTEAFRLVEGREKMIDFQQDGKLRTTRYQIPNKNQCKTCHAQGNNVVPIGPKVANLNRSYTYDGVRDNQLDRWVTAGILAVPPGNIPRWPNYSDVSENLTSRARAYLEVNCAHCHRAEGAASNTKLILQYYNYDSLSYGFRKRPVAPGAGSGGLTFNIVPGHAEQSILYYRMNSTDVRVRMPELGRNLIDEEGVALIKEWIDGMD